MAEFFNERLLHLNDAELSPSQRAARQQFIEALESNRFRMVKGIMRQDDDYCALGVLCELERGEAFEWRSVQSRATVDGRSTDFELFPTESLWAGGFRNLPPFELMGRVGMTPTECVKLQQFNDSPAAASLKDCAKLLRSWWNLADG